MTQATLAVVTPETAVATLPALIDRAVSVLANARTSAEVLEARDLAGLAYDAAKRAVRFGRAKQAHDDLIAAALRAQADAHTIEAEAKRRLADEYDAAQERGEVATRDTTLRHGPDVPKQNIGTPTAADLGLSHKDIHEARLIRDAEKASPGIVRRTLDEALAVGKEPSRAEVRRVVLPLARPERPATATATRGRAAICERVRAAVLALAGLPPAAEVAAYFKGTDAAITVADRLPAVAAWIEEFRAAWEAANADDQE